MNFLLLGLDSLIACLAIGALVDRKRWVLLAALFGLFDGVAFLIGVGLGWSLMSEAASEVIEMGTLVLLGVYLLVVAAGTAQVTARKAIWLLPLALTVDNLAFGLAEETTGSVAGEALAQALSSGALAYLGLFAAVWLPKVLPAKVEATKVAGATLLIGAGALFLVGG
jgi:hypothetical protein